MRTKLTAISYDSPCKFKWYGMWERLLYLMECIQSVFEDHQAEDRT